MRRDIRPRRAKSKHAPIAAIVGLAMLVGCASGLVETGRPLPGTAPNTVNRLLDANAVGARPDLLVAVSFSGGGKRSAAFGHGVLRGMRDVPVGPAGQPTSTLLDEVDQVAGVSGGSFPAAHFALYGQESFRTFPEQFLDVDINAFIFGTFLLPWNWEWLINPLYGTNDRMADIYDRLMFRGATYADLARRGRPALSVNATDIAFGIPFSFTPFNFDVLCSDLGAFRIARAVAASNGFPVLFTPITLQNHRGPDCRAPPPPRPELAEARQDFRSRQLSETLDRYLDADRTRWVHLMDGGIADNLAMRATLNSLITLERQATQFAQVLLPIRRIVLISVDGQAAANPALSRQRVVSGLTQIFSAVSGTQIDNYNVETLMLAESQLQRLTERARAIRCAAGPVIEGRACEDVESLLVRIALAEYPREEARVALQAIPTGLTIQRRFIDQLVAAGESMVREEPTLRGFLAEEPVRGTPTAVVSRASRRKGG
jgi:NTE family protein